MDPELVQGAHRAIHEMMEREVEEETGIVCEVRNLPHGGVDLLTTFDILSEDQMKRYVTVYMVADYIEGGTQMGDGSFEPLEPDKCEKWDWHTLDELLKLAADDKVWIPIDRILHHRKVIGI
jgi:8-oxo-dGTP pyrophosphatase MutT (NUDIX family)